MSFGARKVLVVGRSVLVGQLISNWQGEYVIPVNGVFRYSSKLI